MTLLAGIIESWLIDQERICVNETRTLGCTSTRTAVADWAACLSGIVETWNLEMINEKYKRGIFDPDFCEHRCPICTRARQGKRWAKLLQAIEMLITLGGCPWGRARRRKYGVKPSESLPQQGHLTSRVEQAVSCFKSGFNCSQSILSTYAEDLGLNREVALKLAAGFGGGMGRMAGTCGAVTGAFIVLGLKHGPSKTDDKQGKEAVYERVREFAKRFEQRNGTTVCRDLIQCDIGTPQGLATARTTCPRFIQDAAEILEEMLESRALSDA